MSDIPWFKVDDTFGFHPKAIAAGNAALGLWVRAGAWCCATLTDGQLPRHMIGTFGAQKRDARRLVEAGLWVETDDGYRFNDWEQYQPTKAEVEAERAANRKRQADWRERKRNGVTDNVTNGATNGAPSLPIPSLSKSAAADGEKNDRTDIHSLCKHLSERLTANEIKHTVTDKWRTEARLLLDRDNRDPQQAHKLIDWATNDPFWKANIQSMPKFREKYDQLRIKAESERPASSPTQADYDLYPRAPRRTA